MRGTIIKVPDSSPGLLMVNGEQKPFVMEGVWKSPVAPAANMTIEVQFDTSGTVATISAVDAQELAKERLNQLGGAAQEQGKQAAEMARQGVGMLALRMGKIALGATAAIWIAWFFLPAASLDMGFLGSKSFTFWDLLGIDLSDPSTVVASNHGLVAILGLAAIAAPFAVPLVRHTRASLLNALPLAYVLLATVLFRWNIGRSVGDAGEFGEAIAKSITDSISIGIGAYVLVLAALVLASQSFKRRAIA